MPEIMVRFDDLRIYCEKRHCGSVPLEYINQIPTIEAEPMRRGRWIETRYCPVGDTMYCDCNCSICNFEITRERGFYPRFCEKCGAKMDADEIADASKKGGGADNV